MTFKELKPKIKIGEQNKITLYKASSKIFLWWENKDKWFCNISTNLKDESVWVIEADLNRHLTFLYLDKAYKLKEK